MATGETARATLDDLYRVEGRAELIGGRIVRYPASGGDLPSSVAGEIVFSLYHHAKRGAGGSARTGGIAYAVPELLSGRESFSPSASYYNGPLPKNRMRFIEGPPTFAAEVRSENDYGPAAELEMAAKRADYFQAGTQVVWAVDPVAETVAVYRCDDPDRPRLFGRGDTADAEPAVQGWRLPVADLFSS